MVPPTLDWVLLELELKEVTTDMSSGKSGGGTRGPSFRVFRMDSQVTTLVETLRCSRLFTGAEDRFSSKALRQNNSVSPWNFCLQGRWVTQVVGLFQD